jgi:hypothetical protein
MLSKTKIKEQIESLPENFTIDELVERLVFMNKVESGLSDSASGNKINESELENLIKKWVA